MFQESNRLYRKLNHLQKHKVLTVAVIVIAIVTEASATAVDPPLQTDTPLIILMGWGVFIAFNVRILNNITHD